MKTMNVALLVVALIVCVNVASALPDLVIVDVDFYKTAQCKNPYTLPNGSLAYGKCSVYVGPEGNITNLQNGESFFPKPVLKNIGDEPVNLTLTYSSYLDGKWTMTGILGTTFSIPPGLNYTEVSYRTYLITLGPNQTLPSQYVGAGGAVAYPPDGFHTVSMNFTGVVEANYSNNNFTETIWAGPDVPNNKPSITSVNGVEDAINEGENMSVSFTASDINGDTLTYKILLDDVVVANGSLFTWNTANGYNGTHEFKFVVSDNYTNTTETRNISVTNVLCESHSECSDGNPGTLDVCRETDDGMACVNYIPNFYGRLRDIKTGLPIANANFSFHNASIYDVLDNLGDYESLQPTGNPHTLSDESGFFKTFLPPETAHHVVIQHSNEKDFGVTGVNTTKKIITADTGYIKVFFEKASASLKSDLYISSPVSQLLVQKSKVGQVTYVNNNATYPSGTELKFYIRVNGTPMGLGIYNHDSDSKYCQIEQLDSDTWRLHFEDLPSNKADWDFNDAVVLVDIVGGTNSTVYVDDCDNDTVKNWDDTDDAWCDIGEYNEEINENVTETNFNAEGHIIYSNEYHNSNKYICGERVKFTMFGVNNGGTNETITFLVQDHTSEGGPTAPVIYNGSLNATESLFTPAGNKTHKTFYWKIPCGLPYGRYDIHIVWNGENWHHIGNFFVEQDVTAPGINAVPAHLDVHANQNFTIQYSAWDYPQPGTIYMYKVLMLGYNDTTVNVSVDNGNDGSVEYTSFGGDWLSYTGSLNESGEQQVKLTVTDLSGNNASVFVNVTVFITEEEAMAIGVPWYNYPFYFNDTGELVLNTVEYVDPPALTVEADRYCETERVGDEYMTPGNDINDTGEFSDVYLFNDAIYGSIYGGAFSCQGGDYLQPIYGTTAVGYNYTLTSYFCYYFNVCGADTSSFCTNTKFAPQIYEYAPKTESLIIPYTGAQTFDVLVRDPNAKNFTAKWYVDSNLIKTTNFGEGQYAGGIDSYTFVGNASNIGMHEIRIEVADLTNSTDYDPYNWKTYQVWHLYVDD